MKAKEREIRRKKRILDHAVESGNVAKLDESQQIADSAVPGARTVRW